LSIIVQICGNNGQDSNLLSTNAHCLVIKFCWPCSMVDFFTARRYAKCGICSCRVSVWLSVCLCVCVCLSVTIRYCIKMAKRRIMQIMPYDRSGTLVYQYRLESRTYRMALLIASRGPSALAELLVIQYRSVTDTHTQTDRHTTTAYTALSIASRGKN